MPRLYIPEIGDMLQLVSDWTFRLFPEHRNDKFAQEYNIPGAGQWTWRDMRTPTPIPCTLPAGTVLKVDRIYIRKGQEGFSSLTFYAYEASEVGKSRPKSRGRFWAKLEDVNQIEFDIIEAQKA